ncbi:MAG: tetratricopeptide repeat protein [Phycisphaerales bacterium JB059]
MAEQDPSPEQEIDEPVSPIERLRRDWRSSWQAPALVVAGVLLIGAILFSILTAPKPDLAPALEQAEGLIEAGKNQEALDVFKSKVYPYLEEAGDVSALGRRYHLGVARALYRAQADLGIDLEVNHRNVLTHYLESERQGAELTPGDRYALANTYLSLDNPAAARVRADELPPESQEMRVSIYRRLIERDLDDQGADHEQAFEMLTEMLADPALTPDDRAWALARQTEIRLRDGYDDEAITRLLRAAPRIERASPQIRGRLRLLLGRAYVGVGAMHEAERQLLEARRMLDPGDQEQGEALYYLSLVDDHRGDLESQRDRLRRVVEGFPESRIYRSALMALAESEAAAGLTDVSLEIYAKLVEDIRRHPEAEGPGAREASKSLLTQSQDRITRDEIGQALDFATLAGELYSIDDLPAEVLAALATAHHRSAEQLLAGTEDGRLDSLDPSTRAETQRHLIRAASYYRMHAEAFVLSDNDQYARSLWLSADLFDRAGDRAEAINAFRLYADGIPSDPRNAEARYRLGRAFQSLGDHETAASFFRGLIEDARDGIAAEIGPYADLSYVPLAQSLLHDNSPENDEEARNLLRMMVSGERGDAETSQYREALVELGRVRYMDGEYERAIEIFEEARARLAGDPRNVEIRFLLADAYRLSAQSITDRIGTQAMPGSERRRLESLARERRLAAMAGYEQVRGQIERIEPGKRSALQQIQLRNSYFFMGDCAFDLGDYAAAILHYDRARERYPEDPASLVAMVQIVNAHIEEGDLGRARTANERARRFYESLPEEVWDDPTLPMGRRDWERWLDSSSRLYEVSVAPTE